METPAPSLEPTFHGGSGPHPRSYRVLPHHCGLSERQDFLEDKFTEPPVGLAQGLPLSQGLHWEEGACQGKVGWGLI